MTKIIASAFLLWMTSFSLFSQSFSAQQKAWLYKITLQTPSLKRNWQSFFVFNGAMPVHEINDVVNGRILVKKEEVWEVIEHSIIQNPDILSINYNEISKSSPGLISDVSVKLALWELYSTLKDAYNKTTPFSENETARYFYAEMYKAFPANFKKNGAVHKKYSASFYNLLNPSLPLNKKAEFLSEINKLSLSQQKNILDQWHHLVSEYVRKRSAEFFNLIICEETYFRGDLLAAGEGSGSSGLLYEYEKRGDQWIDTGTGKGIGLFTYQMLVKHGELMPTFESSIMVKPLTDEPTLLHLSLWGMDSSKKPLILIKRNEKSYMLFADFNTKEISPDPLLASGISYLDRLIEFEHKKITLPTNELNKPNGLLTIYHREVLVRDEILRQLEYLELEIDSLNELADNKEVAIESRQSKINVNLSNLNDKESRIKDLERKITGEYQKIDKAKELLQQKESILGHAIQKWVKNDSVYVFGDGTTFNASTQDLIFYPDSNVEVIEVNLLAASFSLESKRKDEVQLYVNTTGGVLGYRQPMQLEDEGVKSPMSIFKQSFFFEPDEFNCSCIIAPEQEKVLVKMGLDIANKNKSCQLMLYANGIDSVNHPFGSIGQMDFNHYHQGMKNEAKYKVSRRVDVEIIESDSKYQLFIHGYTDPVNTSLSGLSDPSKIIFNRYKSNEQTLNPVLSALRVSFVLSEMEQLSKLDFSEAAIEIIPLNKSIKVKDVQNMQVQQSY